MIVTLTVHPSLDRTVSLGAPLRVGEVQTASGAREDAGGKGINVSRVIRAAGGDSLAVLPLDPADPFAAVLADADVEVRPVPVAGRARANITVTDAAGETTKINLPGVALNDGDLAALIDAVVAAARGADWLVLAGSLAPGLAADAYVRVIHAVRDRLGAEAPRIAVDTSGPALRAVVRDGRPDLIKPNDDELADLLGAPLPEATDLAEAVHAAARELVPNAVATALVTLGGDGAVLVTGEGAWAAVPPPTRVRSTVGAGDSSLAGYLLAVSAGANPAASLVSAIRYGSAAAALDGTQAPRASDLPTADIPVRALTR
ncbi:1-phosphofructokinase family hexose kinase [Microbacterium imperiale]|uniref:1-phosphofructokinase n=1 Tax=Microbacterium imperiale TaxID=33884 RepID=A0A9W6HFD6_9MICO|nr:1-phosphofructokinase family hexose kinase [Microbacterium imperiale]MDS0198510.1 1-phosphofructokinase family hexose kinase [Microbacterium imperiale]BFE39965.1 hexose kinase [Microbacterium imperiale]GLJ79060.1 1-phosphofructokinase [Microbacterium imperiale]